MNFGMNHDPGAGLIGSPASYHCTTDAPSQVVTFLIQTITIDKLFKSLASHDHKVFTDLHDRKCQLNITKYQNNKYSGRIKMLQGSEKHCIIQSLWYHNTLHPLIPVYVRSEAIHFINL